MLENSKIVRTFGELHYFLIGTKFLCCLHFNFLLNELSVLLNLILYKILQSYEDKKLVNWCAIHPNFPFIISPKYISIKSSFFLLLCSIQKVD